MIYNNKINVLYVIWSLETGGAERVVVNLVKGLNKDMFNPMVCCLNHKGVLASELEKEGIQVIALNKKPGLDLSVIGKITRIIREHKIKIIHTHLWGANFWGRIAAKKAGVPVIIAHEHGIELYRGKFHSLLDKILYKKTDRVVFVSDASKQLFLSKVKVEPSKCSVIYNGIDTTKFSNDKNPKISDIKLSLGVDDYTFVMAAIGRLVNEKGHEYLLQALKIIKSKGKQIKCLIVGDGPKLNALNELKNKLSLDGSVFFLGSRNDIPEILSGIDLFILPSIKEAMPLSILEAMAAEKPVVATDVGGISESVINGKTGILVSSRNSQALADAIILIADNHDLAAQMGRSGRKRAEEIFSMDKWVSSIENMYMALLEQKEIKC